MRSLLERIVSGEITEQQAESVHERNMGRLEVNFLVEQTRRSSENVHRMKMGEKETKNGK